MKYIPHEYQKIAIKHIIDHPAAALLLDMGLGKTVITLTAILYLMKMKMIRKVLVIAPLRVAKNTWPAEIGKWDHLAGLSYRVAVGNERERRAALSRPAEITIVNRESVPWLIEKSGMAFDYDMIIVDELSSFKNGKCKRFMALNQARPRVKRIVGLTGTPSSNGLEDLWTEFMILDQGARLGRSIWIYRNTFFWPARRNGDIVYSYQPKRGAEEEIYRRIGDITISMKAKDRLKMPELITSNYEVEMDERERRVYEVMKRELILRLPQGELTAKNAATLTGKLLQMSGGSAYTDDGEPIGIHDRKLDALEDIIEGMNGKPLLVAYWFQHDLLRIEERLRETGARFVRLDSPESIRKWNAGEIQVGLAHPMATGHGLNLQEGGNTICWYSPIWSLELYQQMNARLYRQGQHTETVVIMHIVTKNTMDGRVLRALERKDRIQEALIEAVRAETGKEETV